MEEHVTGIMITAHKLKNIERISLLFVFTLIIASSGYATVAIGAWRTGAIIQKCGSPMTIRAATVGQVR